MTTGKTPEVGALGAAEKKVRLLEQQRAEVGGWRRWGGRGRSFLPSRTSRAKAFPGPWLCLVSVMSCHGDH